MGITVRWDDDSQTTICWMIDGRWDWDTFSQAADYSQHLRDSAEYRQQLTIIMNTSNASPIQTGTLPLHNAPQIDLVDEFNGDRVVFVGRSAFNQKMMSVMRRMNVNVGDNIVYANTIDEARFIINDN